MIQQSETWSSTQIIFITLSSLVGVALLCLLQASANSAKLLGQDHFTELNQHVLTTERAWEVHQKSLRLGTNLSFFGGDSEFRAVLCVCLNL
jgi:hypothetical protein